MPYLPFDILTKVDVAAMANSLEVRVPLLDHHVVELAATIPSDYKLTPIDGGRFDKKFLLTDSRRSAIRLLWIDRPKMGFGVPIGRLDGRSAAPREQIERSPAQQSIDLAALFSR